MIQLGLVGTSTNEAIGLAQVLMQALGGISSTVFVLGDNHFAATVHQFRRDDTRVIHLAESESMREQDWPCVICGSKGAVHEALLSSATHGIFFLDASQVDHVRQEPMYRGTGIYLPRLDPTAPRYDDVIMYAAEHGAPVLFEKRDEVRRIIERIRSEAIPDPVDLSAVDGLIHIINSESARRRATSQST